MNSEFGIRNSEFGVFSRDPQGSVALVIDAGPLAVRFERRGDRFVHRVVATGSGNSRDVLESVEGDADDDWPPSPPLQELHVQKDDLQEVALATGMAGTSHWSLSARADRQRGTLTFDVACRVHSVPRALASTYRTLIDVRHGLCVLCPVALDDGSLATVETNADSLVIRPALDRIELPATIRWQYRISAQ